MSFLWSKSMGWMFCDLDTCYGFWLQDKQYQNCFILLSMLWVLATRLTVLTLVYSLIQRVLMTLSVLTFFSGVRIEAGEFCNSLTDVPCCWGCVWMLFCSNRYQVNVLVGHLTLKVILINELMLLLCLARLLCSEAFDFTQYHLLYWSWYSLYAGAYPVAHLLRDILSLPTLISQDQFFCSYL